MTAPPPAGRLAWRLAEVVETVAETPRVRSLELTVPDWPGHRPGQHVDLRLTAEDGYQAQRSYSIASLPEDPRLALTVERLEDGEVSPYLTDELRAGDRLELRGPMGALRIYASAMGTVVRCPGCEAALIRVAEVRGEYWLDLRGARSLRIPATGRG